MFNGCVSNTITSVRAEDKPQQRENVAERERKRLCVCLGQREGDRERERERERENTALGRLQTVFLFIKLHLLIRTCT